jgi:hypothetical protein
MVPLVRTVPLALLWLWAVAEGKVLPAVAVATVVAATAVVAERGVEEAVVAIRLRVPAIRYGEAVTVARARSLRDSTLWPTILAVAAAVEENLVEAGVWGEALPVTPLTERRTRVAVAAARAAALAAPAARAS